MPRGPPWRAALKTRSSSITLFLWGTFLLHRHTSKMVDLHMRWLQFQTRQTDFRRLRCQSPVMHAIGSYGVGTMQNRNADHLIDFLSVNGYFACNTAFQHSRRHRTTWAGFIKGRKEASRTRPVYNQIDYIRCQKRANPLLRHTGAYAGTGLNSDQKLVITRLRMEYIHLLYTNCNQMENGRLKLAPNIYGGTKQPKKTTKNPCKMPSPNKTTVMIQQRTNIYLYIGLYLGLLHSMKTSAVNTAGENQGRHTKFLQLETICW